MIIFVSKLVNTVTNFFLNKLLFNDFLVIIIFNFKISYYLIANNDK